MDEDKSEDDDENEEEEYIETADGGKCEWGGSCCSLCVPISLFSILWKLFFSVFFSFIAFFVWCVDSMMLQPFIEDEDDEDESSSGWKSTEDEEHASGHRRDEAEAEDEVYGEEEKEYG